MDDIHVDRIRHIVSAEFGFWVRDQWVEQLKTKVVLRMKTCGVTSLRKYIEMLETASHSKSELFALAENLWNHETSFWRHPEQMEALGNTVLPSLCNQSRKRKIRLASLGCSTGEEPYSMAMAARTLCNQIESDDVEITGVDVSLEALRQAQIGIYSPFQLRQISESMRSRWFNEMDNKCEVKQEIRKMVRFYRHNLLDPLPMTGLDVIFCCNLLIYFQKDCVRQLTHSLHEALKPGGHLFLGPSESALPFPDLFQSVPSNDTVYYRKIIKTTPLSRVTPYLQEKIP